MSVKGIFVDFGNTLANEYADKKLHLLFCKAIKRKYNIPKTNIEIHELMSGYVKGGLYNSHEKWPGLLNLYTLSFTMLLNLYGHRVTKDDINFFKTIFLDYHENHTVFHENSIQTLQKFKDMGFYIGMISDNDNAILHGILRAKGIKNLFEHIVTSEDVGVGKPNRIIFEKALSLSGLKPQDTIYIGNSYFHDVKGAAEIGMIPLHFTEDFKTWKEIEEKISNIIGVS